MEFWEDTSAGIVIAILKRGDLLLESLEQIAREADIHTGVVMTGIGSLTKARIHTVVTNDYPPKDEFIWLDGPLEVVQYGGVIANHQPHIHISLWDQERRYWGGHLEPGCSVLALSEISIRRCPELRLVRRQRDESGIWLLDKE